MAAQDSSTASYLSRLTPWTRSPTVQPSKGKDGEPEPLLKQQQAGGDHVVSHQHRLSLRKYPRDCPPLRTMWFHAVDSPKRRPYPGGKVPKEEKPLPPPKKYSPFSPRDSKAIEAAYRRLAEQQDQARQEGLLGADAGLQPPEARPRSDTNPNLSLKDGLQYADARVPVNEDYLFDVDIEQRELGPAYWLGPVYDVRRGSWFYQDGSVQKPCEENLAEQLEDGYLKVKAWRLPGAQSSQKVRSSSQPRSRATSWTAGLAPEISPKTAVSAPITPKDSDPDLRKQAAQQSLFPADVQESGVSDNEPLQNTYRLFGAHMNSVVTYQDATTAWLQNDDFMSRMNYSMYERFAGGGHLGGAKLTRGYVDPAKKPEAKDGKVSDGKQAVDTDNDPTEVEGKDQADWQEPAETNLRKLERQMSSLLEDASAEDRQKAEEELRKRDERDMQDYREQSGERQDREIEHLILITHGIGQRLGLKIESLNFIHDINAFRKNVKAVYADSPDLRALNSELGKADVVNSRIQVLPISWRHLLDFPKKLPKQTRKEHDLADTEFDNEDYPNLEDITVEGVPAVRNLITDLAIDILLYEAPAYKNHISRIVLQECNRIYHLFVKRNPNFNGKVSLIGHSLGSAIMFDLLCQQQQSSPNSLKPSRDSHRLAFDFEVEDFYALGSPIGLFQMLKGRRIEARDADGRRRAFSTSMDDPMLDSAALPTKTSRAKTDASPDDMPISSPKCAQIFNIFHPTDPISYRIEPLISPSMSTLKPQPLPYTKRGIFNASMGQGLTGIGARVTQSVSSMWTNVASNLLTRGLGYSGNEQAQLANTPQAAKSSGPLSLAGSASSAAAGIPKAPLPAKGMEVETIGEHKEAIAGSAAPSGEAGTHPPTLIDAELETLYSGFQRRRSSARSDASSRDLGTDPEWQGAEERARRLKREEEKVRRLNNNGRVDYAIQEGVFDINLIAAIASHLSYWTDEDVSHFIISQLLSRGRVVRPASPSGAKP